MSTMAAAFTTSIYFFVLNLFHKFKCLMLLIRNHVDMNPGENVSNVFESWAMVSLHIDIIGNHLYIDSCCKWGGRTLPNRAGNAS